MKFYIKPQLELRRIYEGWSCILLKFYIKPQLGFLLTCCLFVVSYWNSTSNHNSEIALNNLERVVSYWNSTSNHNCENVRITIGKVVSYWNSTSNHNKEGWKMMQWNVVSYWNSTSNHNAKYGCCVAMKLYLIEILHQTTT